MKQGNWNLMITNYSVTLNPLIGILAKPCIELSECPSDFNSLIADLKPESLPLQKMCTSFKLL